MTREQALNYMRSSGWSEEQINTVTEALTCEDAISRQAAIDAIDNMVRRKFGVGCDLGEITLENLPSVSVAEKEAKWTVLTMESYSQHNMAYYECSECGADYTEKSNFCPNCGAKMGVEE